MLNPASTTIDIEDIFGHSGGLCGPDCGALELAEALVGCLGIRLISATCPFRGHAERIYITMYPSRTGGRFGVVRARIEEAIARVRLPDGRKGRAAFVDYQRGKTQSGLPKWRLDTARSDESHERLDPSEAEEIGRELARSLRFVSWVDAPSPVGRAAGGVHARSEAGA